MSHRFCLWRKITNLRGQHFTICLYQSFPQHQIGGAGLQGVAGMYNVHHIRHFARSLKSTTTATMVGGPKEFGGTKGMLLYLLVPPKSLFCPSNSVYSPPQTIVLSPQIPNHLSSPQNNCSVPSNSVSSRSQNHSVPSKVNCPPKLPVMFREK